MELLHHTSTWVLFSFLIFVVMIIKLGKTKFMELLDGRIKQIREEINTAESLRIEAQELLAQYQRKHRDAMKDAEKIIAHAKENAEESRKLAEAQLEATLERREQQLKDRIARMEQNAVQEIQSYAAELAMNAAAEIISEKLDKKTGEKLIDQSIRSLAGQIH